MSDPNFSVFENFLNAFRGLVDADEATTLAAIKPILGDQVNESTLRLIGSFLTKLFYEDVEIDNSSYVCLRGIKLPLSSFTFLKELEESTPPGVLSLIADGLAAAQTGVSFPLSFVTESQEVDVFNPVYRDDVVSSAKIKLYKVLTGGNTVEDFVAELRLPTPTVFGSRACLR